MTRASWFLGRQHSAKAREGAEAAEGPPVIFPKTREMQHSLEAVAA
jgi:hypothetical protein